MSESQVSAELQTRPAENPFLLALAWIGGLGLILGFALWMLLSALDQGLGQGELSPNGALATIAFVVTSIGILSALLWLLGSALAWKPKR